MSDVRHTCAACRFVVLNAVSSYAGPLDVAASGGYNQENEAGMMPQSTALEFKTGFVCDIPTAGLRVKKIAVCVEYLCACVGFQQLAPQAGS